jgi:hypothetical protein
MVGLLLALLPFQNGFGVVGFGPIGASLYVVMQAKDGK